MPFVQLIWKDLRRRPIRSGLTVFGVALSIAAVIALLSLSRGFERDTVRTYDSRGVDLVVVRAGVTERLTSSLREDSAVQLKALPPVADVAPTLSDLILLDGGGLLGMPLSGWPVGSFLFDTLKIAEGRTIEPQDKHAVLLGAVLAESLGKHAGDSMEFEGRQFQIVGVYRSPNVMENGSCVMALPEMQDLMDRQGQVTEFQLKTKREAGTAAQSADDLRAAIENLRDNEGNRLGLSALPTQAYVGGNTRIRLAHGMAWITSAIALIIGSVGMLNTMLMSVLERTQEIGILRAIGWRRSRIIRLILGESCLLSLGGAVVGWLMAWGALSLLWLSPTARGLIDLSLSPTAVAAGWGLAAVAALLGGGYPAWHGAGLSPIEALHYE